MLGYLSHRPTLGTQTNLFIFENGNPLTRPKLVSHLRQAITLDPKAFSGHSFRIGAASTAAAVGLNDSTIQQAGRWKSNTFRTYIRKQATQQLSSHKVNLKNAVPILFCFLVSLSSHGMNLLVLYINNHDHV